MPKRSQSSQDMLQPIQRQPSSLPPTPEKPPIPQPELDQPPLKSEEVRSHKGADGKKALDSGVSNAKGGGAKWGIMGRVASGLLGSGSKRSTDNKGVSSCQTLTSRTLLQLHLTLGNVHSSILLKQAAGMACWWLV